MVFPYEEFTTENTKEGEELATENIKEERETIRRISHREHRGRRGR
jgi:hypothetical protein